MIIGLLQVRLHIPEARSLKGKRLVVKGLIERLRRAFNASVSELDEHDKWQLAILGVVVVGNERRYLDHVLGKVLNFIRTERRLAVIDSALEFL